MNVNIDHLHPANWFPYYEPLSDRRAVPVTFFVGPGTTGNEEDVHSYLWNTDAAEIGLEPWSHVEGYDQLTRPDERGSVIVETGRTAEKIVLPDHFVYIPERAFHLWGKRAMDSLTEAYDALWAMVKVGVLARHEFDERANALRELRAHYKSQLQPHEVWQ